MGVEYNGQKCVYVGGARDGLVTTLPLLTHEGYNLRTVYFDKKPVIFYAVSHDMTDSAAMMRVFTEYAQQRKGKA